MEMPVSYRFYFEILDKILYSRVRKDVRGIISMLCKICVNHVHLGVVILPKISVSNFIGYLKWKSRLMFYD